MVDIVVSDAAIFTMDDAFPFYRSGTVAVDDGKIVAVGPTEKLKSEYSADILIDGRHKLLVPGLINCHTHVDHSLGKGLFSDLKLQEWESRLGKLRAFLTPENGTIVASLAFLEMIKTGTSCFVECGTFPGIAQQVVDAAVRSGLRGIVSRRTVDTHDTAFSAALPPELREDTKTAVEEARRFVERYNGIAGGRIHAWFNLMVLTDCSDELCIGLSRLTDEYRVGMTIHAAWHRSEVEECLQRFGSRPVERLDKLGVLSPRLLAAHMGFLDGRELRLVKEHDVKVCHCPSATLHSGYGCAFHGHFPEMHNSGVNICLGTDGASSSNFLDMVREMYLLSTVHKEKQQSSTLFTAMDSLHIATRGGARALGIDDSVGSISPGKKADLALFDLGRIEFVPSSDKTLLNNLVYSATGGCCTSVIVDGRVLMLDNEVLTVRETEILDEAQSLGESLAAELL